MLNNIDELIKRGSSTARNGFRNEDDVVRKFNDWKKDEDARDWLEIMNYNLEEIEKVEAVRVTGSHKTDVQVKITIYLKEAIAAENISVKLVTNPQGFNQIDKRWVDKYKELWNIPDDVSIALKLFTGEITPTKTGLKDPRRMSLKEMDDETQEKLVKFFEENKIMAITDIFKGRDKLAAAWMLIYIKETNLWSLLPMSIVMNFYGNGDVRITNQTGLKIGKVGVQRKGGDQGRPTANMLQFKINPAEIVNSTLNGHSE